MFLAHLTWISLAFLPPPPPFFSPFFLIPLKVEHVVGLFLLLIIT